MKTLINYDGDVRYERQFLSPEYASTVLAQLQHELHWVREPIVVHGRRLLSPRLQAWHGDAGVQYRYSGRTFTAKGWTPTLTQLQQQLQHSLSEQLNRPVQFNAVLCNQYRNGNDYIGWHSDNEAELGEQPVIASISLGDLRRFLFRHRRNQQNVAVLLEHGSLLVMQGETQLYWQHALPRKADVSSVRINLTFRCIIDRPKPAKPGVR